MSLFYLELLLMIYFHLSFQIFNTVKVRCLIKPLIIGSQTLLCFLLLDNTVTWVCAPFELWASLTFIFPHAVCSHWGSFTANSHAFIQALLNQNVKTQSR